MVLRHCTCALLATFAAAAALAAPLAAAPQQAAPEAATAAESTFVVFARARSIGSEVMAVTREGDGWVITSSGRLNAPIDVVTRRLTIRYDAQWKPLELSLDATVRGQSQTLHTRVAAGTATSEIGIAGQSRTVTGPTAADVLIPNLQFASYEALSARLRTAAPGSTILGLAPAAQVDLTILVGESSMERTETGTRTVEAKRTHITVTPAIAGAAAIDMEIWGDSTGRLLRVSVPAQALEVVRDDLASAAARQVPISRPNDEQVRLPSNGFTLAGTLSKPATPAVPRLPAVVMVGGSGPTDRDELVFGIPIFGQLAGALADAGFVVLRYDKRGVGQSGGRPEAAALADYADDARAAVTFLAGRKDVDPNRIAMIGHSEGGSVAMLAAAKNKRIAALVLVATIGVTGAELNLAQVKHGLDRSTKSEAEKNSTLELQRKIQHAVLTGTGWEQVATYRQQADTPWFQSLLAFDPAKVMPNIRQPLLIIQGALDTQVVPSNGDRLKLLADARKNRPETQVVTVPGVNHLLVPATTGEFDEYATLKDKHVSLDVSTPISAWLTATLTK
jgi:pimeloyl-ACP methyl ester carboxylesterase